MNYSKLDSVHESNQSESLNSGRESNLANSRDSGAQTNKAANDAGGTSTGEQKGTAFQWIRTLTDLEKCIRLALAEGLFDPASHDDWFKAMSCIAYLVEEFELDPEEAEALARELSEEWPGFDEEQFRSTWRSVTEHAPKALASTIEAKKAGRKWGRIRMVATAGWLGNELKARFGSGWAKRAGIEVNALTVFRGLHERRSGNERHPYFNDLKDLPFPRENAVLNSQGECLLLYTSVDGQEDRTVQTIPAGGKGPRKFAYGLEQKGSVFSPSGHYLDGGCTTGALVRVLERVDLVEGPADAVAIQDAWISVGGEGGLKAEKGQVVALCVGSEVNLSNVLREVLAKLDEEEDYYAEWPEEYRKMVARAEAGLAELKCDALEERLEEIRQWKQKAAEMDVRPRARVVIGVDRDAAGVKRARRIAEEFKDDRVRFALPSDGKDFDEMRRLAGPDAVVECLARADWWPTDEAVAEVLSGSEKERASGYGDADADDVEGNVADIGEARRKRRGKASGADEGKSETGWLEELNSRYFPVDLVGKMFIAYQVMGDLGNPEWRFMRFSDFKDLLCNQFIKVREKEDGTPVGVAWLSHPDRNANRLVRFDPALPPGIEQDGLLNRWSGFRNFGDGSQGTPDLMVSHIREVICRGDSAKFEYLIRWLAFCVQRPWDRPEVAVVMLGKKGAGKGALGQLMTSLFASNSLHMTNREHVVGRFNSHLANCVFAFADESFFAGDHAGDRVLKGLITEPRMIRESKGVDAESAANRLSIMMAANDLHAVQASADERRYFAAEVSEDRIGDRGYFDALAAWRENGHNVQAFLDYLKQLDISQFNPRIVPQTTELCRQKEFSLPMFERWLVGCVAEGAMSGGDWVPLVTPEALFEIFSEYSDHMKTSHYDRMSPRQIGTSLKDIFGFKKREARSGEDILAWVGKHAKKVKPIDRTILLGQDRVQAYDFGALVETRKRIIQALKLSDCQFEEVSDTLCIGTEEKCRD